MITDKQMSDAQDSHEEAGFAEWDRLEAKAEAREAKEYARLEELKKDSEIVEKAIIDNSDVLTSIYMDAKRYNETGKEFIDRIDHWLLNRAEKEVDNE